MNDPFDRDGFWHNIVMGANPAFSSNCYIYIGSVMHIISVYGDVISVKFLE